MIYVRVRNGSSSRNQVGSRNKLAVGIVLVVTEWGGSVATVSRPFALIFHFMRNDMNAVLEQWVTFAALDHLCCHKHLHWKESHTDRRKTLARRGSMVMKIFLVCVKNIKLIEKAVDLKLFPVSKED